MILLLGCAHNADHGNVIIGPGLSFRLRPPGSFGENLLLTQVVTVRAGDEVKNALFYTEINSEKVAIVGTDMNGIRIFSVTFDGENLHSDPQDVQLSFDPKYLVADMQIALWPYTEVIKGLAEANRCFYQERCRFDEASDGRKRRLIKDEEELLSVTYGDLPPYRHTILYDHHVRRYILQVETLSVEFL